MRKIKMKVDNFISWAFYARKKDLSAPSYISWLFQFHRFKVALSFIGLIGVLGFWIFLDKSTMFLWEVLLAALPLHGFFIGITILPITIFRDLHRTKYFTKHTRG